MRLEDTIKYRLFRVSINEYTRDNSEDFVIECKADIAKPVPLCIPIEVFRHTALVYRQLYISRSVCSERSTPRALYNMIFSGYYPSDFLGRIKIKDNYYYVASGVLFNADKDPLFYFAQDLTDIQHPKPWLYLTPRLLADATVSGKPMEKFFMSTIVPYLINNDIYITGHENRTVVEIDNHIDDTFFMPNSTLLRDIPVNQVNDRLNDILVENADVISRFTENYSNP